LVVEKNANFTAVNWQKSQKICSDHNIGPRSRQACVGAPLQLELSMKISDDKKWLACYFPSSWLTNLGHGMIVTVVGPTQPYLAQGSILQNFK
jgi:hypothetical protein